MCTHRIRGVHNDQTIRRIVFICDVNVRWALYLYSSRTTFHGYPNLCKYRALHLSYSICFMHCYYPRPKES
ncbi:hypothetical protein ODDIEODDIE_87 [Escherichia phage vB_EcoS_OddieOddie]|nr:hypothetical protein ODDIEODDIE_87 [Escherichia phage vB_EcoS_OddieOddie]